MRVAGAITGLLVLGSFTIPGTYDAKRELLGHRESAGAGLSQGSPASETGPGTISGRVYDPDGAPLANASVWLAGSGFWPARSLRTAADGRFAWSNVPAGVYELRAEKDDWVAPPVGGLLLEPGAKRVFALRLGTGWTMTGRVVDAQTGRPIPNAWLTLVDEGVALHNKRLQSDAGGRFVFGPITGGAANLYAEAPGYAPLGPLASSSDEPSLEVRMQPGATIEGKVFDSAGRPIAGAVVRAIGNGRGAFARLGAGDTLGVTAGPVPPINATSGAGMLLSGDAETDGAGSFRMSGLQPGRYSVVVTHEDFAPGESGSLRLQAGGLAQGLRVVLRPGVELQGRVVDARGYGLSAIPIELRATAERFPRMTSSGEDGSFAFKGVAGEVTLTARPLGLPPARVEVLADPARRLSQSIELVVPSELQDLHGRVIDTAGFGIEDALIKVFSLDPGRPFRRSTRSEPDGVFALNALPDPPYQLTVERRGYSPARVDRIETVAPLEVVLSQGATVSGRVVGDWHGEGLVGVEVELEGPLTHRSKTNEDGGFKFVDVPRGPYRIAFSHPDYESHTQLLSLEDGQGGNANQELDVVRLTPAGSIVGEVRDASGDPVPNAEVTWGDPPLWRHATRTDAAGNFRLRGVQPGVQWVSARHFAAGDAVDPRAINVRRNETSPGAYIRLPERLDRTMTVDENTSGSGLAITLETVGGEVRVSSVQHDSTASDRLRPGDVLASIDGEPVTSEKAARELLRGAPGVEVVISVQRQGSEQRTFVIERERFEIR